MAYSIRLFRAYLLPQLLTWTTVWFLIIPIAPAVVLWTMYKFWKSGLKRIALGFLLLSPFVILPVFNICKAYLDYSSGRATIGFLGYPSESAENLDPVLRLRHSPRGAPTGVEYLTVYPYNAIVKTLISRKGHQPDSYSGFLPTSKEAKGLLQRSSVKYARATVSEDFLTITVEERTIKLDLATQPDQIKYLLLKEPLFSRAPYVVKGDCLVIALNKKWIYLIDIEGEELLSHFPNG